MTAAEQILEFPTLPPGATHVLKLQLKNRDAQEYKVRPVRLVKLACLDDSGFLPYFRYFRLMIIIHFALVGSNCYFNRLTLVKFEVKK